MQYLKLSFIVFFFSIVVGCSSGSGDSPASTGPNPIEVKSVYTDVANLHESVFEKFGNTADYSIGFVVSLEVGHRDGIGAITRVYIENEIDNLYWDVLGGPVNRPLADCYDSGTQLFECSFYSNVQIHSIELTGWLAVIEDRDGNSLTVPFTFSKPGGEEPQAALEFVYSEEYYLGNQGGGTAALEILTVLGNEMVFESNPGTQSFRVEFETSDARANRYDLVFHDGTAQANNVAYVCSCDPSIESTPIILGQKVVLDVPWSELRLRPGFDVSDIDGLHIRLLDTPIDWETELQSGIWFNHLSYSELITL